MQEVVAAIIEKKHKILIARRKTEKKYGGLWEFPGGKLEQDEAPEIALQRELQEELGINAKIGKFIGRITLAENNIAMSAYEVKYFSGEMTLLDHSEFKWVKPSELNNYEYAPADIPLIEKYLLRKTLCLKK
jgi:8-oxo-dGTP diphosphatase